MPKKNWNGSVYPKGQRLYVRLRVSGKWKSVATPYLRGQESQAWEFLRDLRRRALAAEEAGAVDGTALTVTPYVNRWLERRRSSGDKEDVDNEEGRLRKHVLPYVGDKRFGEVLPAHVRAIVDRARSLGLAYRTVRNIYSTFRMVMNDAVVDGLMDARDNPCVLTRSHLPPNRDKNPRWRATAVFDRQEMGALLYVDAIPEDRRVYYALLYFTGVRLGEASGLLVDDYDSEATPLGRILVSRSYARDWTKTGVERAVPVHPELKRVLEQWLRTGWEKTYGRPPKASDIIVPTPPWVERTTMCQDGKTRGAKFVPAGIVRNKKFVRTWFLKDLKTLGLRHRRVHDFRRSMISHARGDGADRDVIERISHRGSEDVLELYTTFEWEALCSELSKLRSPPTPRR